MPPPQSCHLAACHLPVSAVADSGHNPQKVSGQLNVDSETPKRKLTNLALTEIKSLKITILKNVQIIFINLNDSKFAHPDNIVPTTYVTK